MTLSRSSAFFPPLLFLLLLISALPSSSHAWDASGAEALEWAADHGYTIGALKAGRLPDRPRGLIATANIKAHALWQCTLSYERVAHS